MKLPPIFTLPKISKGPMTLGPQGTFAKPQILSAGDFKAELRNFDENNKAVVAGIHKARDFFSELGVTKAEGNGPVAIDIDPSSTETMYTAKTQQMNDGSTHRQDEHIIVGRDPFTGQSFGRAPDVIAHEYAHRINEYIVPGLGLTPLSRVVDESIADTMAAAIDGNWTIGEGIINGGLRSLQHPESQEMLIDGKRTTVPTLTRLDQITAQSIEKLGPYANMGPLNNAAYKIGTKIGAKPMAKIYLQTLRNYMKPESAMTDLVVGTIKSAGDLFGKDSDAQKVVRDAWKSVGASGQAVDAIK